MRTTDAYVVTDLHPSPKGDRWLTWGRVGRFLRADLIALVVVATLTARGLWWFATSPSARLLRRITGCVLAIPAAVMAAMLVILIPLAIINALVGQIPEPTQQDRVNRIGIWVSQGSTWGEVLRYDQSGFGVSEATAQRDVEDARASIEADQ